jgi:hypothetical protein
MRKALMVVALGIVSAGALAQVYSWKDANGQVHYSDQPPPGKQQQSARKIETKVATPEETEATRKAQAERELDGRQKQKQAQDASAKQTKAQQDAEDRKKGCTKAKAYVKALEGGQINSTINDQGKTVPMDKSGLAAELADARKSADAWCKE